MLKLLAGMMLAWNVFAVEKSAFSGTRFFYYDMEDRVEILTDIYKQTKAEYALWEIKKRRIGVDGDKVFTDAITLEKSIADVKKPLLQSRANLDFISRVKEVIAKFQDTHFGMNPILNTPWVLNGLDANLVDGKILITGFYDKVIKKTISLSDDGNSIASIAMGDEVISVDGIKATEFAKGLEKYVDGSSEGFRRNRAGNFLMARYFAYPTKPYSDFEIKVAKLDKTIKVRLPWYASDNTKRKDAMFYFKESGFPTLASLRFKWNDKLKNWEKDSSLKFKGFNGAALPHGALELENWKSAAQGGSPIVRSAVILKDAKAYGFLQINSFSVRELYKGEEKKDFISAIRGAVKYFKEQNLELILDLRNNGGGNGNYPEQVLSLLTEKEKTYQNTTWAKRITRYTRQFIDYYLTDELYREISNEEFWQEMIDQIYVAVSENRDHTPAITEGIVEADEKVGGFENKIVALISPSCISACDIMSMLLQGSKRATLIGTTANGTGAGYWSNDKLSTQFQDRFHVFRTNIPNSLFGYPGSGEVAVYGEDSAYEMNSENVPVIADIQYIQTMKDLTKDSEGWINKAIEVLKSK
jgi:hypothetical protein